MSSRAAPTGHADICFLADRVTTFDERSLRGAEAIARRGDRVPAVGFD